MKKIFYVAVIMFSLWFLTADKVLALGGLDTTANGAGFTQNNIWTITGNAFNLILSFVGVLFLLMMFLGGFMWMTAQGNPAKAQLAQKLLVAGVIGLIIVVSAYAITAFVGDSLKSGN